MEHYQHELHIFYLFLSHPNQTHLFLRLFVCGFLESAGGDAVDGLDFVFTLPATIFSCARTCFCVYTSGPTFP